MARRIATIDDYIAAQPEAARQALERVRCAIGKALPNAGELISYQMPAFRVHGRVAVYFAGWKDHYAVYPASDAMIEALEGKLGPGRIKGRTFQFPFDKPVPVAVIARIAKLRARETSELIAARKGKSGARTAVLKGEKSARKRGA